MTTQAPPSVVQCLCGQKNRRPAQVLPGFSIRCGSCKRTLVDAVPAAVDIDDDDEDLDDEDLDDDAEEY